VRRPAPGRRRRLLGLAAAGGAAAAAVAAALAAAAFLAREPAPPAPWQRVDLAERPFRLESASGAVGDLRVASAPSPMVHPRPLRPWGPPEVRSLRQALGSRIAWEIELGAEPYLSVAPLGAVRNHCRGWQRVLLRDAAGGERELLDVRLAVTRAAAAAEREIALGRWAGRTVTLVFEVEPVPDLPPQPRWRPCRAAWGAPAVVHRAGVPPPPRHDVPPNVLLVGLDTFRADHWTSRPAGRSSFTPALDALAAESDVWLEATSTLNNTNPSFASIHTGLYGRSHGIYRLDTPLGEEHTTLAERFRAAGYDTAAFLAVRHLLPAASGLGQGFDEVHGPRDRETAASGVVDDALGWLAVRREPFFLWVHLFDVHSPTLPPEPFAFGAAAAQASGLGPVAGWRPFRPLGRRDIVEPVRGGHPDLYAGEAAFIDRQVDRLLGFLRSRGLLERTLVAVVGDHGESLGEHGILHSHAGLYEPSVHVPLVVRWPDASRPPGLAVGAPRGRRFRGLVQTLDLAPSLLAATGVDPGAAAAMEGRDLWRWVGADGGGGTGRRAVVAEHADATGAMIRTRRYKYIEMAGENPGQPRRAELYDLAADPGETIDLAGRRGLPAEERLAAALTAWRAGAAAMVPARQVSDDDIEALRALGYLP
jgi:arylsulfatase